MKVVHVKLSEAFVCDRGESDNSTLDVLRLHFREEQLREVEVSEMVDTNLFLKALRGELLLGERHDSCVVDEEIYALLSREDAVCKSLNREKVVQI